MQTPGVVQPGTGLPAHLRLRPLEELWAIPLGFEPHTAPLLADSPTQGPREALELSVLSALQRPPCMVSAHVARREGLPAPVPITNRFPAVQSTHESEWQERVLDHLGLDEWVRLEWEDELDVLGPIAQTVLRRHGLLFPFNAFFHYPMLERAQGGSLLTGVGGDELFTRVSRGLAAHVLFGRRRPRPSELHRVAFELSPRPIRAWVDAARDGFFDQFQWIRAPRRRRLLRASIDWQARKPLRNDRALREWWWPSRMLQCGMASMRVLAGDFDVAIGHPLADRGVLGACARGGGAIGLGGGSRARAVKELVADLLPLQTLERRDKTIFDGAFWKDHARSFAAGWAGSGVDRALVDIEELRAEWAKDSPFPQTFIQLQRAWLHESHKPARTSGEAMADLLL
jgi:asparagine synthase (glutamine-hydrolysing)